MRILMVCLGNICRSPTAEGVLRARLRAAGIDGVGVDSAGTGSWHVGDPPDARAIAHAARRGIDLAPLRARQVGDDDFERFDLILAMDEQNLADLRADCPPALRGKLLVLMDELTAAGRRSVPDPYAHGPAAFERVLDLVEAACDALGERLAAEGNFRPKS